jgi:ribosomal protein S18 acetylase RimI-like enzyme
LELLRRSAEVVLAVQPGSDRVIGFVNLLSDHVLTAYIPLLEVLPEFRGQGIGAELIRRVLDRVPNLYMVDVTCDANVQPFYESLGFSKSLGASLRRYEHQAGAVPANPS